MDFRFRDYLLSPLKLLALHRWMRQTPAWSVPRMNEWIVGRLRELARRQRSGSPITGANFAGSTSIPIG